MRVPARLEELHQRRQRIRGMPVRVSRPHDVPARRVDRHRRIEGDLVRQQLVEQVVPFLAAARVDLVPQPRHLGEAVRLVVVVVVGRIRLDAVVGQQRVEQAVEVLGAVQAEAGGVTQVHPRQPGLGEVRRRPELQLARPGDQRPHHLGILGEQLEPVGALGRDPGDPLARLLGRRDRPAEPAVAGARPGVDDDPGRGDLVAGAAGALAQRPVEGAGRHAADRRDAVRQPQLVDVLRVRRLAPAAGVDVAVDEAGHDVEAGAVDLPGGAARTRVGADGQVGIPDRAHLDDPVARDHDVHRALRRGAGAVDHRHAAEDQPLEGALALAGGAIRGRPDGLRRARRRRARRASARWQTDWPDR